MPCKMCEDLYIGKPCRNEGKIEFNNKSVDNFNKFYVKTMFKILRKHCPCMECLVKVVCLKYRLDCELYITLLASANKKGYSSK
jgi:hypothetical protein